MVNLELNLRSSENEKPQDVEKNVATALRTLNFSVLRGVDKPKYALPPAGSTKEQNEKFDRKTVRAIARQAT